MSEPPEPYVLEDLTNNHARRSVVLAARPVHVTPPLSKAVSLLQDVYGLFVRQFDLLVATGHGSSPAAHCPVNTCRIRFLTGVTLSDLACEDYTL